jgi:outer membrane protein assembly factor BamB
MAHYAYDPATGTELWRVEDRSAHSASSRMTVGNGLMYILTGWAAGPLLAIRPGRVGEVLDVQEEPPPATQLALVWKVRRSVPRKPSVTVVGELLFMVDDGGIASCLDALTGEEHWRERVGGEHSASPLYADGRLYFCNEVGKTTVVGAQREFEILAENHLGDGFMASPAASGRALFLRSRSHLYRIGASTAGVGN